jgi:opacity protein-like surface antigen
MPSGSSFPSATLRHASAAAGALALLAIVLTAAPAFADPSLLAATPRLLAVDYVSKLPPGVSADSDKVYMANMHEPRTHTGAIHLHGGVWAPIDASVTNAMLGMRIGVNLGEPVLFGVLTGWTYHTKSLYDTVASGPPGLSPRTVLATGTAHLIPAMVFLQVTLTQKLPIVPYAGIAAGYEWLHLAAKDYRTDADTSLTYANLAWEWYAGVGLKLSRSVRVDGEVYYNGASLTRDVPGVNNRTLKEAVDMDGAGARIGLNIVY